MRGTSGLPLGGARFSREKIGPCFGFCTGHSQSTDGNWLWERVDAFGGAVRGPSDIVWRAVITSTSIPAADQHDDGGYSAFTDRPGIAELVCAPSNGQIALMWWDGWLWLTKDGVSTPWVKMAGVGRKTIKQNSNASRAYGRYTAIHPTDPNKAIVGTQGENVYATTNLLAATPTWTALGLPAGTNEPSGLGPMQHIVLINPVNPSEVFVNIWGTGWYKSATGVTGPFNLMSGTSTYTASRAKFSDTGTLWFVQYGATNNLYKLPNGAASFTNVTTGGRQIGEIAIDWSDDTHLICVDANGAIIQSHNIGSSWPDEWPGPTDTSPPKQITRAKSGKAFDAGVARQWAPGNLGNLDFDRANPGGLIASWGFGFHRAAVPASTANPVIWIEDVEDIPMLVTQCGVFSGSNAVYGAHDVGVITVKDQTRYNNIRDNPPSTRDQPHLLPPILVQPCTDLCVAADDPSVVYAFMHGGTWSDFGATHGPITTPHWGKNNHYGEPGHWSAFPTQPNNKPFTFGGGFMIVGPVGHVANFYNMSALPEYTEDDGNSWHDLSIPGLAAYKASSGLNGIEYQGNGFWLNRKVGDYDKTAGQYRVFFWGDIIGFYEASALSGTWTRVSSDSPIPSATNANYVWHAQFFHVPGQANHAFWSNGIGFDDPFMRTTNGCVAWSRVDAGKSFTITAVTTFHFTAAAPAQSYPCVVFHGKVNGNWGYYRSDDNFATEPKFLAKFAMGWMDGPLRIFGNPNVYHDFGICYSGSGAIRAAYDYPVQIVA
jgi:hypothetical protein